VTGARSGISLPATERALTHLYCSAFLCTDTDWKRSTRFQLRRAYEARVRPRYEANALSWEKGRWPKRGIRLSARLGWRCHASRVSTYFLRKAFRLIELT